MAYIAHVVTGRWGWHNAMTMCVPFVQHWVLFLTQAAVQSFNTEKNIDRYFQSQFYVENPAAKSQYSFYRMGQVNTESECMTEINICHWWDSNQQLLIDRPAADRWATIAPLLVLLLLFGNLYSTIALTETSSIMMEKTFMWICNQTKQLFQSHHWITFTEETCTEMNQMMMIRKLKQEIYHFHFLYWLYWLA